jgi:hypothetical protein
MWYNYTGHPSWTVRTTTCWSEQLLNVRVCASRTAPVWTTEVWASSVCLCSPDAPYIDLHCDTLRSSHLWFHCQVHAETWCLVPRLERSLWWFCRRMKTSRYSVSRFTSALSGFMALPRSCQKQDPIGRFPLSLIFWAWKGRYHRSGLVCDGS